MLLHIYFIAATCGLFCVEAPSCAAAQDAVVKAGGGSPLKADRLDSLSAKQAKDLAKRAKFIGSVSDAGMAKIDDAASTSAGPAPQATLDDVSDLLKRGGATMTLPR